MTANYCCPTCDGRLRGAGAANVWRCRRCGQLVVEVVDETRERVREFYRRATGTQWGGLR
jgi:tRNA(Ile2) C34 agmatinyltransferase TiaS